MAAPGLGVGDIILACQTIYDYGKKYSDAPEDLRIIADKACSLATTLQRIKYEGLLKGNIVQRAEDPAEKQLRVILKPLREDVKTLEELVRKYNTIRQDAGGYGRRLMFALKESGGLADRRRQIELHEQTLQMWYMTVIVSSLRRIEGGVEDLAKLFETMRKINPRTIEKIREMVTKRARSTTPSRPQVYARYAEKPSHQAKLGSIPIAVTDDDAKPLKEELLNNGLSEAQVDATLGEAIKYLFANPVKQDQMEEEACQRASTMRGQSTRYEDPQMRHADYRVGGESPTWSGKDDHRYSSLGRKHPEQGFYASKSSRESRKVPIIIEGDPKSSEKLPTRRRTNSGSRLDRHYHNKETLRLHNKPHEETIEIPEVLRRSRSSGQPRRVSVERPPPGYLDVPESNTRYRYSSPSRHHAWSESPDSEMVQVRRPRIERSQSPSPGVTHYLIRE